MEYNGVYISSRIYGYDRNSNIFHTNMYINNKPILRNTKRVIQSIENAQYCWSL